MFSGLAISGAAPPPHSLTFNNNDYIDLRKLRDPHFFSLKDSAVQPNVLANLGAILSGNVTVNHHRDISILTGFEGAPLIRRY